MSLGDSGGINIITAGGIDTSLWRGSSQNKIIWAYKTSTSLAFSVYNYDAQDAALFSIIITKDSNGDVCAVVVNEFIPSLVGDNSVYAISTTSELVNTTILRPNTDKYTTAFCPLIVSGTTARYLPNVYYMPFAQYSIEGSFLIDNVIYLCNGIIAVKDEYRG
jgi:hypothetical protein